MHARLRWLNSLPEDAAGEVLLSCCGSRKWAEEMTHRRPFADSDELAKAADQSCDALAPQDWKEAFAAHPRIGENKSAGNEQAQRWSEQEQAAAAPSLTVQEKLKRRNEDYYCRFGYIFIVCATGKSAQEMLALLEQRIHNDPARELEIAAEEQRKITQLRLQKLIAV